MAGDRSAWNGSALGGRSRWADVDGPVHYLDFGGPARGPVIVCVHGLSGSVVNWAAIAPLLTNRYRLIAPDLAGHGLTRATGRDTGLFANRALLHRFIESVSARQPGILMGNSMGGMISLMEASASPETGGDNRVGPRERERQRRVDQDQGGHGGVVTNRVSAVPVNLPVGEPDPRQRLALIREQMDSLKRTSQAVSAEILTGMLGFTGPLWLALGSRAAFGVPQPLLQTVVTNVPGPRAPLYILGRRMSRLSLRPDREQRADVDRDLLRPRS